MIDTLLTKEIFKTLDYARNRRCCVLIQGRTGRGKTEAAKTWCDKRKEAIYIDCPAEGGRPALAAAITEAVGAPNVNDLAAFLTSRKTTLVFDECARLLPQKSQRASILEWLRRLHDQSGVALAFIATDFFIRECSAGSLGEYLEQLIGRFRDKLMIPDFVSSEEGRDILSSIMPEPTPEAIAWAVKVANEPGKGGARRLWWLLDDAADIAKQTKHVIDVAFLQAVLKDYEGRQRLPEKE